MKLLIITQKVNKDDSILGFFHRWIEEFAKNTEQVTVICLEEGEHNLPQNVRVFSLGKEKGDRKLKRVLNFYKYIWQFRKDYDAVFVHMNPIYLCLAGLFFKLFRKPAFLWYTHKHVDLKLKIAVFFAKKVFTASTESLRFRTNKKVVTGHGIDTEFFKPTNSKINNKNIITVGRISSVKNIDKIVEIVSNLKDYKLEIVGAPVHNNDFEYAQKIYMDVQKNNLSDRIVFSGPVKLENLPEVLNKSHIFINMSKTGSLDKAILEALSCGLQVITTNVAARDMPGVHFVSRYSSDSDISSLVDNIKSVSKNGVNNEGRNFVVEKHSIKSLVPKIISYLQKK